MHILCLTMIRMRFGIGSDPEHVASTATGSTACYLFVQIFVQDPGGLDKQSAILSEHTRSADGSDYTVGSARFFKKDIQCWIVFSCMP